MTEKDRTKTSSYSDKKLFEEISKGQSWAFSVIYDRYSAQLYGLALKILQNRTLAQDAIQDIH